MKILEERVQQINDPALGRIGSIFFVKIFGNIAYFVIVADAICHTVASRLM